MLIKIEAHLRNKKFRKTGCQPINRAASWRETNTKATLADSINGHLRSVIPLEPRVGGRVAGQQPIDMAHATDKSKKGRTLFADRFPSSAFHVAAWCLTVVPQAAAQKSVHAESGPERLPIRRTTRCAASIDVRRGQT